MKVLQAVEHYIEENIAYPILLGRPDDIKRQIRENGLSMREGIDFEIQYEIDEELRSLLSPHFEKTRNHGARSVITGTCQHYLTGFNNGQDGDVDTMICGSVGRFHHHLRRMMWVAEQPLAEKHYSP